MGYYKIIQERDSDAGMGMRDPMEEAFREALRVKSAGSGASC